jgi:hypothetical protein
VPDNFLDVTALSIKKYRKVTNEIAKLSPAQKLVGSLALLAAGYVYLNKVKSDNSEGGLLSELKAFFPQVLPDKTPLPTPKQDEDARDHRAASHKSPKTSKAARSTGTFGKKAAASSHDV